MKKCKSRYSNSIKKVELYEIRYEIDPILYLNGKPIGRITHIEKESGEIPGRYPKTKIKYMPFDPIEIEI